MRFLKLLPSAMGLVLALALALPGAVSAQNGNTIRLVVPYPPGGTADVMARLLSQQVNSARGTNIIIENRPGAGTVTATDYVARQPPDGNTALIMSNSFVINSHMRKLNYDPLTSFAPVCNLVTSPNLIVVNAKSPYRKLADLLTVSKANPGELTVASVGPATTQHIGFLQLNLASKAQMTFVPFPGGAPAVNALLGDHVTAVYANYSEVIEQLRSGKLRALAATGAQRIGMLPDVPTIAEQGFPGYDVEVWLGMVVPTGTPQPAIDQLAKWFTDATMVPDVRARLVTLGMRPAGQCGAAFAKLIRARDADYARIMSEAGIKGE
jgi:tripartite-type tricarboxylate transporter receptor subunit TctC